MNCTVLVWLCNRRERHINILIFFKWLSFVIIYFELRVSKSCWKTVPKNTWFQTILGAEGSENKNKCVNANIYILSSLSGRFVYHSENVKWTENKEQVKQEKKIFRTIIHQRRLYLRYMGCLLISSDPFMPKAPFMANNA